MAAWPRGSVPACGPLRVAAHHRGNDPSDFDLLHFGSWGPFSLPVPFLPPPNLTGAGVCTRSEHCGWGPRAPPACASRPDKPSSRLTRGHLKPLVQEGRGQSSSESWLFVPETALAEGREARCGFPYCWCRKTIHAGGAGSHWAGGFQLVTRRPCTVPSPLRSSPCPRAP